MAKQQHREQKDVKFNDPKIQAAFEKLEKHRAEFAKLKAKRA